MLIKIVSAFVAIGYISVSRIAFSKGIAGYRIVLDQQFQVFYGDELITLEYRGLRLRIWYQIFGSLLA